ncbi:MAG TPA: hypothetical protein PKC19_11650, partial [Roseiflexaceae bacterium]|nr:hypothetical protein [Roseiflexaceae bacterium]
MIPARRSFSTLLLLLWQITYGGARTLVWGSLRESAIDLRPLSWAARLVALVGLGLIILLLAGILFNDILRTNGPLVALQLDSASGRAALAPAIALPLTLGVQALGWSLALAGALQVRPAARLLVIVCYILFGMQPLVGSLVLPTATPMLLAALPIGGLLLVSLLVLSRHPLPFALSFSLLGMLHSLLVALALAAAAQA